MHRVYEKEAVCRWCSCHHRVRAHVSEKLGNHLVVRQTTARCLNTVTVTNRDVRLKVRSTASMMRMLCGALLLQNCCKLIICSGRYKTTLAVWLFVTNTACTNSSVETWLINFWILSAKFWLLCDTNVWLFVDIFSSCFKFLGFSLLLSAVISFV